MIGDDLESQFAALCDTDFDAELEALKAQVLEESATPQNQTSLLSASGQSTGSKFNQAIQAIEDELELLRSRLDQM